MFQACQSGPGLFLKVIELVKLCGNDIDQRTEIFTLYAVAGGDVYLATLFDQRAMINGKVKGLTCIIHHREDPGNENGNIVHMTGQQGEIPFKTFRDDLSDRVSLPANSGGQIDAERN